MATSEDYMIYVTDQLREAGNISFRKMFGEYVVYCNSKVIGLVCDSQFYLKKTESGRKLIGDAIEVPAYEGAKPSFLIESIDDRDYMVKIVKATYEELPDPKPKKASKPVENKYICYCAKVTEGNIVQAIYDGASSVDEVIKMTGAMENSDCALNNPKGTCCYSDIVRVFKRHYMELNTERLNILPLDLDTFKLLLEAPDKMENALGLVPSGKKLDDHTQKAMEGLYLLALGHTNECLWFTNWQVILKSENEAIGSLCFMGLPNESGEVEIGYGINDEYRNCGYMTEAVTAACKWALSQHNVNTVIAESEKDNTASHKVLSKCGMKKYYENDISCFWRLDK